MRTRIYLPTALAFVGVLAAACGDNTGPTDASADVSVTVTAPGAVAVDQELTYTIIVRNTGPAAAEEVVVLDSLPEAVTVETISGGGTTTGREVAWPAIASLSSNGSREFSVTVTPTSMGVLVNRVRAVAATPDPNPSNNDGSADASQVETLVSVLADVRVSLAGPNEAVPGTEQSWEITVTNDGPSSSEEVVIRSSFPAGVVPVAASDDGAIDGSAVEWQALPTLVPGESVTRTVTATAPFVGPATSVASATSDTEDPTPGNNDGSQPSSNVQTLTTYDVIYSVAGEAPGDQFGWLFENLGDIDGDGANDYVVTAPGHASNRGRIYVYSGADGSELFRFTGEATGARLGLGIDLAGDIDADGVPDVIVGAPNVGPGFAYVLSGVDGSLLNRFEGENPGDQFGFQVARAGDVDGDGRDDVMVGAISHATVGELAGRAYVYSGLDYSLILTLDPAVAGGRFGHSLGAIGDIDGNGRTDLAIGAPTVGGGGRVYVFLDDGTMPYPSIAPDATGGGLGFAWLESPGDLNDDGIPDIFAADIDNRALGTATGRAYVFSGADGSTIHTFTGENAGDQFGIGRSGGDADGDGVTDIFVAAWLNSEGAAQAGKAYLFSGASGELVRTFTGTTAGDVLGFDAVGIGDVDGDGTVDYLLSGAISQPFGNRGRVDVVRGIPLP